jgi:hypothetical protein
VFAEAAQVLHDGLVLDHLDEHDSHAEVAGLWIDLVPADPGAAVRERARAAWKAPGDLHDRRRYGRPTSQRSRCSGSDL